MRILGLDFETTGLEAATDRVIEIGAVVWDTDLNKPLALMSEIIKPDDFTSVPQETTDIHGITTEMVQTYGVEGREGFARLIKLLETCQCVVAHNAPFDRGFFEAELHKYGFDIDVAKIEWVDTMMDIPYPKLIQTRKLTYLAAEHGIVNHHAHRAVTDVLVMLEVLKHYSFNIVFERSKSPKVQVVAKVSFEEKDKAKDLGFHWNPKNKTWFKEYKEIDLEESDFPFKFEVLQL